jgi:hypothetical protein
MDDAQNVLNDDSSNDTSDDDLLLDDEREVATDVDNPLIAAEREALKEEEFSEPLAVDTDPGIVDEEAVFANLYEEGAGANVDSDDLNDLGMHIEEFSTDSASDDLESLDSLDDDTQL